ncbi:MAG: replicative DNA helicase [Betaproteobacteria bacterium]
MADTIRKQPVNPDAERAFVGTLIVHPDELPSWRTQVSADDIFTEVPRRAYAALCALADAGREISPPLLLDAAKLTAQQIAELMNASLLPCNLPELADVIREDARKRRLIQLARDLALRGYDPETTADEAMSYAENVLAQLHSTAAAQWISNRDLLIQHFEVLEARHEQGGVIGVPTGFKDLDEHLGGLVPGNLVFLAATPKTGKTSWALHVALNCGVPCLFFTLEMLPSELADRQLAMKAKIPARAIRTGKLDDEAWKRLGYYLPKLADVPLAFVSQSGLTAGDMRAICQHYKQRHGLGLVIIDQLDKIHEPRMPGENDTTRIGRVTRGLKVLARDLEVPVICLAQLLDKAIAQRRIPRPQHGDIRDSSYPDQDADVVLYLWRPTLYWPKSQKYRNMVEIIIARSRATAEGSVWVRWEPEYTLFELLDKGSWPKDAEPEREGDGSDEKPRKVVGGDPAWRGY